MENQFKTFTLSELRWADRIRQTKFYLGKTPQAMEEIMEEDWETPYNQLPIHIRKWLDYQYSEQTEIYWGVYGETLPINGLISKYMETETAHTEDLEFTQYMATAWYILHHWEQ